MATGDTSSAAAESPQHADPPDRTSYHHGDLRNALIDVGLAMLAREKAEALTLRRLARAAGVSQTAPYRHFNDRTALWAALSERGFRQLHERLVALHGDPGPAPDRLTKLGRIYVQFALDHPGLYKLMFGTETATAAAHNADPNLSVAMHACFQELFQLVQECESAVGGTGHHQTGALAAWSMVHGLAQLLLDDHIRDFMHDVHGDREALITDTLDRYSDTFRR